MPSKEHLYEGKDITVSYDLKRCTHAAECVHGLGEVFDPDRKPWIDADAAPADEIAEVITQCPTGALHFERHDGGQEETTPEVNSAQVCLDGPLYLQGNIIIQSYEGETIHEDTRMALCRCGASKNKPFCDNRHQEIKFSDAGEIPEERIQPPAEETASGPLIVITKPNGSVRLQGPFTLVDTRGRVHCPTDQTYICRCGASPVKPFCDGTHKQIGFTTE